MAAFRARRRHRVRGLADSGATACGETVDVSRHAPSVEIKGTTYTALPLVCRDDGLWITQCEVDA